MAQHFPCARVDSLWRYAVKGLDRDALDLVKLDPGSGFPSDRRWALQYAPDTDSVSASASASTSTSASASTSAASFTSVDPLWLHKSNFLCAFTAGELLGSFETTFDDATDTLVVRPRRSSPDSASASASPPAPLLSAVLTDADDRARVEAFFSHRAGRRVVLRGGRPNADHFGNTPAGVRASGDPRVIHIVNANTVRALAAAAGVDGVAAAVAVPAQPGARRGRVRGLVVRRLGRRRRRGRQCRKESCGWSCGWGWEWEREQARRGGYGGGAGGGAGGGHGCGGECW